MKCSEVHGRGKRRDFLGKVYMGSKVDKCEDLGRKFE